MKKCGKRIVTLALALALVCGVAVAASAVRTQRIEANYMDIKLVVDGVEVTPRDVNGNIVEPFASEGTTYLPVRAVANALGKDVEWDGESKTVYIGPRPGGSESWMRKLPPYQVGSKCKIYDGSDAKSYFTVGGVNHTEGVSLHSNYDNRTYALWNTNLQYRTMSFKIGHLDGYNSSYERDAVLEIYLDGELSNSYNLKWDGPIQTIELPLNYAGNVKLQIIDASKGYAYGNCFGIFDITFAE